MQYFYSGLALWIKYCITFDPCGFTLSPFFFLLSLPPWGMIRSFAHFLSAGIFFSTPGKDGKYFSLYFHLSPRVPEPRPSATRHAWSSVLKSLFSTAALHFFALTFKNAILWIMFCFIILTPTLASTNTSRHITTFNFTWIWTNYLKLAPSCQQTPKNHDETPTTANASKGDECSHGNGICFPARNKTRETFYAHSCCVI